jgi:hypothetical protein
MCESQTFEHSSKTWRSESWTTRCSKPAYEMIPMAGTCELKCSSIAQRLSEEMMIQIPTRWDKTNAKSLHWCIAYSVERNTPSKQSQQSQTHYLNRELEMELHKIRDSISKCFKTLYSLILKILQYVLVKPWWLGSYQSYCNIAARAEFLHTSENLRYSKAQENNPEKARNAAPFQVQRHG